MKNILFLVVIFVSHGVQAQTISTLPQSRAVAVGESATFTVAASGTGLAYQWQKNGVALASATSSSLTIANVQPSDVGIYTVLVSASGLSSSASAVLGLVTREKVTGAGTEVVADIKHPSGNTYDQILLQGNAAAITADAGQVTRISYIDLNDDIVQVEFAGTGTLTLVLDNATGPAAPLNYDQSVTYMKGHARIVIAGADENTNVSVFSVGRGNAVNQALFKSDVTYDGLADIASIAIVGGNGKFGGVRTANANYFATKGITGLYAPDTQFTGPVFLENINAFDAAKPALLVGAATDVRITGGDLKQSNSQPVQVAGVTQLRFADGSTSHGTILTAQIPAAQLQQSGVDVTNRITGAKATSTLYIARLRPENAAPTSMASGYATVRINSDGTATVNVSFSNLTSAEVAAHLKIGSGDYVLNLPLGQVSDRTWTFARTGAYTTTDLIYALNTGGIFVGLDSAKFPGGELRGTFLTAAGSQTFTPPPAPPPLPAGALTGPTQTDAARFLTQATFGPTITEIHALVAKGITKWIDEQMALAATSHLAGLLADVAEFPNPNPPPPTVVFKRTHTYNRHPAEWKIMITAPDQLRQRVAFALSEIFVISSANDRLADNPEAISKYYDILANGAFGNFRQLLDDITLSPAMGWFLSYEANVKANPVTGTSPDENYAREVQQLFTIGLVQLHPDGSLMLDTGGLPIPTYDQTTITETAKVFTGWTFNIPGNTTFGTMPATTSDLPAFDGTNGWLNPMRYSDAQHDKTAKSVVSLQQVPLAQAAPTVIPVNQTGPQDLKIMLDTLFNHPNTGPFICKQLIQRLVTSNPSPGYIYRVAKIFANDGTGTRGNLGAVIRTILTDYEARSPAVIGNVGYGKLKEPIIRIVGFFRALKVTAANGRFLDSWFGDPQSGDGWTPNAFPPMHSPGPTTGQATMSAPTVFNFFSPDFSPPGALAAAGLVTPELEITDGVTAINVPNFMLIYLNRTTAPRAGPTPSPFLFPDFTDWVPNGRNTTALLDQINLIFCSGNMSAETRSRVTALHQVFVNSNNSAEISARAALHVVLTSPDAAVQR